MMKKKRGFTIIELIITLAVFSILVALVAPSVTAFLRNNRSTTQTNEFVAELNIARSEAVKRGTVVTMCITDGNSPPDCDAASTAWHAGWIVFTDENADASFDNATDNLIRIHAALTDANTLISTHFEGVAYNIQYNSSGKLRERDADSTTSPHRTFTLCDPYTDNQKRAKAININKLGNISIAVDTDSPSDGVVDTVMNNNVTCPAATK